MSRRRPSYGAWGEAIVVSVAFLVGASALMWPVLRAPADRVYGLPSDPLSEVWRLEQFRSGQIELVGDRTSDMANLPSGVDVRRPLDVTQIVYDVVATTLVRVAEPVLAYNLLVLLALASSGIAMYWAARGLGSRPLGAATAGAVFLLAPVHLLEAQLHLALAFTAPLPLLLLLGVRALETRSWRRGAAFGAALGACGYFNAYLLLEASVVGIGLALAATVVLVGGAPWRPIALTAGAAALGAAALLAPILVVLVAFKSEIDEAAARSPAEANTYSLRLVDYADRDGAIYMGAVVVGLAILALIFRAGPSMVRLAGSLVAVSAVTVSLRGDLTLAGVDLPMPSDALHSLVPYWRVFGRVAIVATLGVAVLAALALDRLAMRRWVGTGLAAALAVAAVADVVREPPPAGADLGRPDPVGALLAGRGGAVAEYPLFGFDNDRIGPYLFRQLRHARPLLNGAVAGTASADLSAAAADLAGGQARAALALAGVRTIVLNPPAAPSSASGLRLLGRFEGGTVYEVNGAPGGLAVAAARDAYPAEPGPDGSDFAWLGAKAGLAVVADRPGPVLVSFRAVSHAVPRIARIGSERVVVGTAPTAVTVCLAAGAGGTAVTDVETTPPAAPLPGGDTRVAGIGVYRLSARPGCDRGR